MLKRKRIVSLILVLLMLITILPLGGIGETIKAAETDVQQSESDTGKEIAQQDAAESLFEVPELKETGAIGAESSEGDSNKADANDSESSEIESSEVTSGSEGSGQQTETADQSSISGTIWLDSNEDGICDDNESPVIGYKVSLYLASDKTNAVSTAITDSNGRYIFEGITPNDYVVGIPLSQKVSGTEYLVPMVGIRGDNKFNTDENTGDAYTDTIKIDSNTIVNDYNAGVRLPGQIMPASGNYLVSGHMTGTYFTLKEACDAINNDSGSTYTITATMDDMDMGTVATIDLNKDVTLTSNSTTPYTIIQKATVNQATSNDSVYSQRHFYVEGRLTLENISLEGDGYTATKGTIYNGGVFIAGTGSLVLETGALIEGCYNRKGGAVYVNGGTLTINGGDIRGNRTPWGTTAGGAGVYMTSGAITMTNGVIGDESLSDGNESSYGGGIYVADGNFDFSGGKIIGNTATGDSSNANANGGKGGGIYMTGSGILTINGTAEIKYNDATILNASSSGGGVFFSAGEMNMSSGTISGNTVSGLTEGYGGGVHISGSKFNMSGGVIGGSATIDANTANTNGNGGGVSISWGIFNMSGTAKIIGNEAHAGGGVYVSTSTFNMEGTSIIGSNAATYNGGGVYLTGDVGSSFILNGSAQIIDNNTTYRGGGIYSYRATLSMYAGNISRNSAGSGGGVHLSRGSFTMSGGIIGGVSNADANKATLGAGVYVAGVVSSNIPQLLGSATFIISGTAKISCNIAGTSSGSGAGVYVDEDATLDMQGGTICDNEAGSYGGGVYLRSEYTSGYGFNCGVMTMGANAVISGNSVPEATGLGGGIYVSAGVEITLDNGIVGGSITADANSAYKGGGIYLAPYTSSNIGAAKLNIGSSFKLIGNKAVFAGGGIYGDDRAEIVMNGGEISENEVDLVLTVEAKAYGGGIYIYNGSFDMDSGLINKNIVKSYTNGPGKGNGDKAESYGGGLYMDGGTFNMSNDSTISENQTYANSSYQTSSYSNGFAYGGGLAFSNCTINIKDSNVTGNEAYAEMNYTGSIPSTNPNAFGGGLFAANSKIIMEQSKISNNKAYSLTATGQGGGVCIRSGSNFEMRSGTISENQAGINDTTGGGFGGGVALGNSSKFEMMDGCYIKENIAYASATGNIGCGGGIYNTLSSTFIISGGIISGNRARNSNTAGGGGIYGTYSSTTEMHGGTITGNYATNSASSGGGGLLTSAYAKFYMYGGTITENYATNGGGIGIADRTEGYLYSGTISNNQATNNGGGIFLDGGIIEIDDSSSSTDINISENEAEQDGGGVYITAGISWGSNTFTMISGTIKDNRAVNGGGLYVNNSTTEFTGGTIESNRTYNKGNGGGLYINDTSINMSETTISSNEADINGGGVYVTTGGQLIMNNTSIVNNDATNGDGGAIFTEDYDYHNPADSTKYSNISITGGTVSGNTAWKEYVPPINETDFTSRVTNSFEGTLLTNYQINYRSSGVVTIIKNGQTQSEPLAGVAFTIERYDTATNNWVYLTYDSTTLTWSDTSSVSSYTQTTAIDAISGKAVTQFVDLPTGSKYRITEVSTSDTSYTTLAEPIEIENIPLTVNGQDYYSLTYTIYNGKAIAMPVAGDTGFGSLGIFLIFGTAMMLSGGVMFIYYMKKRKFKRIRS